MTTSTTTFTPGVRKANNPSTGTYAVKTKKPSSLLEGREVVAAPSPAKDKPTRTVVKTSDLYRAQTDAQDERRRKIQEQAVNLITMPMYQGEITGSNQFTLQAKVLSHLILDDVPSRLAAKVYDVFNYKLGLGHISLGTTTSLALAATARLVSTVAFATLELAAAAFVAGAALTIGTAVVIASSAALVAMGGTALATSPFSVPIMIYKWTTDLQKTVTTIKKENSDLKRQIEEITQKKSPGKLEEGTGKEESLRRTHSLRKKRPKSETNYRPLPGPISAESNTMQSETRTTEGSESRTKKEELNVGAPHYTPNEDGFFTRLVRGFVT